MNLSEKQEHTNGNVAFVWGQCESKAMVEKERRRNSVNDTFDKIL